MHIRTLEKKTASLFLVFITLFGRSVVNLHAIFLRFTFFWCCARSVKNVHGGIFIYNVLFVMAAIFSAVVDVFLSIEMTDADTHSIKIANLCRYFSKTASSKRRLQWCNVYMV